MAHDAQLLPTVVGARIRGIMMRVGGADVQDPPLADAVGRQLEEFVELCLACGMSGERILGRVTDTLANEAAKAGCYPSELVGKRADQAEITGELGDVRLGLAYVANLAGVFGHDVDEAALAKIARWERQAEAGELHLTGGTIYRKRRVEAPA